MLKKFYDMKQKMKNSKCNLKCKKMQKVKIQKFEELKTEQECFYKNVQCVLKKLKFLKEQKAKGLISSSTGIKIPYLIDLPILDAVF